MANRITVNEMAGDDRVDVVKVHPFGAPCSSDGDEQMEAELDSMGKLPVPFEHDLAFHQIQ